MAFKPNYNHQRIERDRAKQAKKEEKLKRQQERALQRKAARESEAPSPDGEDEQPS